MSDTTQQDRLYSLQEASAQCGLAPYIVRYWEIHFPELGNGAGKGKSQYSASDVALLWRIKKLLYVDRLTIEQAKQQLSRERAFPVQYPGGAAAGVVRQASEQEAVDSSQTQHSGSQPSQSTSAVQAEKPVPSTQGTASGSAAANDDAQQALSALSEVREQLSAAREQAAQAQHNQQKWEQESLGYRQRIEQLEQYGEESAARMRELEAALAEIRQSEAALREELSKSQAQAQMLAQELTQSQSEVQRLAGELEGKSADSAQNAQQIATLQEEKRVLEVQLEELRSQAGEAAAAHQGLNQRNAELEQTLAYVTGQLREIAEMFNKQ